MGKGFLYSNKIRTSVFDVSQGNSCALVARSRGFSFKTNGTTHAPRSARIRRAKKARKTRVARERSRVFIIRLCHHRKKKLQRRAIRLESLRQFNTRREEKEMRVRGLKNAERRKAHNDAADDDEKEEEEKKGEKESRKARREKIPP